MSGDLVPSNSASLQNSNPLEGGHAENLPAGGVDVPLPRTSSAGRKAEIERIMREDYGRYVHERLDREHLEILEQETADANPDAVPAFRPLEPAASRAELCETVDGQQLVSEWDEMGGFGIHLRHTQEAAKALVKDVADTVRGAKAFMARFDADVPEPARMAVYRTLAAGAPQWVTPVDNAGVAKFKGNPVGVELVGEWGPDAPKNIARVWERVNSTIADLFDEDKDALFEWFASLNAQQAKAIVRRLAQ